MVQVNRESNVVADALAKIGRSAGRCILFDFFPDHIWNVVTQDIALCDPYKTTEKEYGWRTHSSIGQPCLPLYIMSSYR
jgi:hypothetical protein